VDSRKRFRESLLFGKPDKVALTSHFGPKPSLIEKWHSEGLPPDDSYLRIHGLEHCERLEIDFSPLPRYREEILEERGNHKVLRNFLGQTVEHEREPSNWDYQTRAWRDFPVKSRKDFENMQWRYNPRSPGRYPVFWKDISRSLSNRDYPVSITFPSMFWRARDWTGLKGLSIMFHRDPELVQDMFSFWTDFVIEATRLALRTVNVDYVLMSDDMAYKGRAMVSPDIMRRFMLPLYRRWVDHFRGHGVEIIMMDSDGYIHEIAPVWAEAGINALCPMEIRAGNDLLKLRDELGHSMAFRGA
jgi:hypothetical protein